MRTLSVAFLSGALGLLLLKLILAWISRFSECFSEWSRWP